MAAWPFGFDFHWHAPPGPLLAVHSGGTPPEVPARVGGREQAGRPLDELSGRPIIAARDPSKNCAGPRYRPSVGAFVQLPGSYSGPALPYHYR